MQKQSFTKEIIFTVLVSLLIFAGLFVLLRVMIDTYATSPIRQAITIFVPAIVAITLCIVKIRSIIKNR